MIWKQKNNNKLKINTPVYTIIYVQDMTNQNLDSEIKGEGAEWGAIF